MSELLRSLIARMADELDHYRQLLMDDRREAHALAAEARAALSQSEPDLIEAVERIRQDPDDCKDYENNYRTGWVDACNAVLELLHSPIIPEEQ